MSRKSSQTSLTFVNISHPENLKKKKSIQTVIRRHVMRDIGKQRRRRARPGADDALSPNDSLSSSSTLPDLVGIAPIAFGSSVDRSLLPLGGFPISTNTRMFELASFYNDPSNEYFPFREIWFEISLSDPGAFHVTLGNAAALQKAMHSEQHPLSSREVQNHYQQSLIHLRKRLSSEAEVTSDGIVANILAHVCLNEKMRTSNWKGWAVHMKGLELVHKARGGFEDLPENMRIMIFWYDLAGAMAMDSVPRFPLPRIPVKLQCPPSPLPVRLEAALELWMSGSPLPTILAATQAIRLAAAIANVVNLRSHSPVFWKQDVAALMLTGPCIHYLLSMPKFTANEDSRNIPDVQSNTALAELLRLNLLVAMALLKERFTMFASERPIFEEKLSRCIAINGKYLGRCQHDLALAALTTASLMQRGDISVDLYLLPIVELMFAMGLQTGSEVLEVTRQLFWINILHSPTEEKFTLELDRYITRLR